MARIMKVRTIPRGYVEMGSLKDYVHEHNGKKPAEWFMALYGKFGNPQVGGVWSYLLRHNNILIKVTATDGNTMDYDVWVAPGFVLDAKRKRTKVMNVIARRLNEKKVVFLPNDGDDNLYYAVRIKNSELMAKQKSLSIKGITEKMNEAMTDEEKEALYGDISQYMTPVKEEIVRTINEIFDEEGNVLYGDRVPDKESV